MNLWVKASRELGTIHFHKVGKIIYIKRKSDKTYSKTKWVSFEDIKQWARSYDYNFWDKPLNEFELLDAIRDNFKDEGE